MIFYQQSLLICLIFIHQVWYSATGTPLLQLPSLSIQNNNLTTTTLQCISSLLKTPVNNSIHPADPYTYRVPDTSVKVVFYDYGDRMEESCAQLCLNKASRDVPMYGRDPTKRIGRGLNYNAFQVFLTLNPWSTMEWGMWSATLKALTRFVEIYVPVEFEFDVTIENPAGGDDYIVGLGRFGSL